MEERQKKEMISYQTFFCLHSSDALQSEIFARNLLHINVTDLIFKGAQIHKGAQIQQYIDICTTLQQFMKRYFYYKNLISVRDFCKIFVSNHSSTALGKRKNI